MQTQLSSTDFIVSIGRDAALLSYCDPDVIVTIHAQVLAVDIPQIVLSEIAPESVGVVGYDTDLMEYLLEHKEVFERVCEEIERMAAGRSVVLNPYYNSYTKPFRERGYEVVGPQDAVVWPFSFKRYAYQVAQSIGIPVVEGRVCSGKKEVVSLFAERGSLFVSFDEDPFHPINRQISEMSQIAILPEASCLVTFWQEVVLSPNVQVLIGANDVLVLGVMDQIIRDGVTYYGNRSPHSLTDDQLQDVMVSTSLFAKEMQKQGYRGIAGFDFLVTAQEEVLFVECNPRKNRSSSVLISEIESLDSVERGEVFRLERLASAEEDLGSVPEGFAGGVRSWVMEVVKQDQIGEMQASMPVYSERELFHDTGSPHGDSRTGIVMALEHSRVSVPDVLRVVTVGEHQMHESFIKSIIRS